MSTNSEKSVFPLRVNKNLARKSILTAVNASVQTEPTTNSKYKTNIEMKTLPLTQSNLNAK